MLAARGVRYPFTHDIDRLIAETFAVLTAAGPYHVPPVRVGQYLEPLLGRQPIGLAPASYARAVAELAESGVSGGAAYDGLIALGARDADATLVSLDRRATATYHRLGVEVDLLL